jgi:hypothetical protein
MEFIFEFCCWVGLSEPLDQNIGEGDVNSGAEICNRGDTIGYGPGRVISGIQYKFAPYYRGEELFLLLVLYNRQCFDEKTRSGCSL